jgi:hypothetical protein
LESLIGILEQAKNKFQLQNSRVPVICKVVPIWNTKLEPRKSLILKKKTGLSTAKFQNSSFKKGQSRLEK